MKKDAFALHSARNYLEISKTYIETLSDGLGKQNMIECCDRAIKLSNAGIKIVDPENVYYSDLNFIGDQPPVDCVLEGLK